jgi:hypothetical protein
MLAFPDARAVSVAGVITPADDFVPIASFGDCVNDIFFLLLNYD